jgi:SAM-dependent methyltransferase
MPPALVTQHNTATWDHAAATNGPWSSPVTPDDIQQARQGDVQIRLTPSRFVPADWLPPLTGLDVLGLASGGGQQAPVLAAAGARVTVADISEGQLHLDRVVAEREQLHIDTVQADATDLSMFADASFDLIVHPIANAFIPDLASLWRETFRVLRPGGTLVAGFNNPAIYLFDWKDHKRGVLTVRHQLPFSDAHDLPVDERDGYIATGVALEYSHTLEEQLGGQIAVGFEIIGFFEDRQTDLALAAYMATSMASRARKPRAAEG